MGWGLVSVAVGLFVPLLGLLTVLSTPILAVMIGSISLTLTVDQFRQMRGTALLTIIGLQASMPFVAFGLARVLSLSPALTAGFVILGAVPSELVTPVMTKLGGRDTDPSATVLIVVGLETMGVTGRGIYDRTTPNRYLGPVRALQTTSYEVDSPHGLSQSYSTSSMMVGTGTIVGREVESSGRFTGCGSDDFE